MEKLKNISARICNYKCFGEDGCGFEGILPINLIIGRNNTGKSTLLELIDYLTLPRDLSKLGHNGKAPQVILSDVLTEEELRQVFRDNASGGTIPGNHWKFGCHWVGKRITWTVPYRGLPEFVTIDPSIIRKQDLTEYERRLANVKGNPFSNVFFRRLLAERDITPEKDSADLTVQSNGRYATNVIQHFINKVDFPSELVEDTFLNELNSIFGPDGSFTDIVVQQLGSGNWEVYLEEAEKGRVPLSHTGSGLKTILLVLVFLYLVPRMEGRPLSGYLFGFEELENNLHPSLQRRLLLYLRKIAIEQGCRFFLTTHSNIPIDLFANDDKAQILHVTHDGRCASVKRVITYVDNKGILDDLDIRASDLLQANGIVWVEGPSDRLYFNRWIEIWSERKIKKGAHYQCVFYGGRLLAHLSANDPEVNTDDVVKILRINRNAILIVDSDRECESQPINATKDRILSEIKVVGGMAWLTAGKEIENYIPNQAVASLYGNSNLTPLEPYKDIVEYLDEVKAGEGKRLLRNKVLFAEQVCPHIDREGIMNTLDLPDQLTSAYNHIRTWNGSSNT